jgi:hypothetical protein
MNENAAGSIPGHLFCKNCVLQLRKLWPDRFAWHPNYHGAFYRCCRCKWTEPSEGLVVELSRADEVVLYGRKDLTCSFGHAKVWSDAKKGEVPF